MLGDGPYSTVWLARDWMHSSVTHFFRETTDTLPWRNDHTPKAKRRKSLVGRTSETGYAIPLRVTSAAREVQEGKYFQVEDILDSRQRKGGGSTWSSGKGMGTSAILGNVLRISKMS